MKLYVLVDADLGNALVRSPTDLTPITLPKLVIGDGRKYELYFIDREGNFLSWSGNAGHTPKIAIGECGYPTAGTFTITFDGDTTTAIALTANAATIQAALEALASVGSGNVLVTAEAGKWFSVEFIGALAGAAQPEMTCNFSGLTPASTIDVTTEVEGDVGVNEVQFAEFTVNPWTYADNWTTIANGWEGELSTATLALVQKRATAGGSLTGTFQVTVLAPAAVRPQTYVKQDVTVVCSVIRPSAYAGADKPTLATTADLAAAVLGAGNFTREALSSSAAGNTNVTVPSGSKHHIAIIDVTGVASTRTLALPTTYATAGAIAILSIRPDTTPSNVIEIRNATSGGTLLETITTGDSGRPYLVAVEYTGAAWQLLNSDKLTFTADSNLEEVVDQLAAKRNLGVLNHSVSNQTADFTVTTDEDGVLFDISTAAGDVEVTLPSAVTAGQGFAIQLRKADTSANVVTTSPASITLNFLNDTVLLVSNGTTWIVGGVGLGSAVPAPTVPVTGDMMYFDGTSWVALPIGTDDQLLIVAGGVPAYASRNLELELAQTGLGTNVGMTNALPANARIAGIIAINETANAITGLKLGTAPTGSQIVAATDIAANGYVDLTLVTRVPFGTSSGTVYVSATSWNSGTVKIIILYQLVS